MRIPQMLHISTMWMWMDPQCYAQELSTLTKPLYKKPRHKKKRRQKNSKGFGLAIGKKQGGRE